MALHETSLTLRAEECLVVFLNEGIWGLFWEKGKREVVGKSVVVVEDREAIDQGY